MVAQLYGALAAKGAQGPGQVQVLMRGRGLEQFRGQLAGHGEGERAATDAAAAAAAGRGSGLGGGAAAGGQLVGPGSHAALALLHTSYTKRDKTVTLGMADW